MSVVAIPLAEAQALRTRLVNAIRLDADSPVEDVRVVVGLLTEAIAAAMLSELREAVKVQGLTVHATLVGPVNPTSGLREVLEVEPCLPALAVPQHGDAVTLTSGRRGRVFRPNEHAGLCVEVILEEIDAKDLRASKAN